MNELAVVACCSEYEEPVLLPVAFEKLLSISFYSLLLAEACCAASIDTIYAPSHKGSQVRCKKDDHVRHFFRRPQPTQRQSTQTQFVAHSFLSRKSALHGKVVSKAPWSGPQGRPDGTRCYGVHADAAWAF